jgi:hypothetical protein
LCLFAKGGKQFALLKVQLARQIQNNVDAGLALSQVNLPPFASGQHALKQGAQLWQQRHDFRPKHRALFKVENPVRATLIKAQNNTVPGIDRC